MRALTDQRVRSAMGIPLLKQTLWEQKSKLMNQAGEECCSAKPYRRSALNGGTDVATSVKLVTAGLPAVLGPQPSRCYCIKNESSSFSVVHPCVPVDHGPMLEAILHGQGDDSCGVTYWLFGGALRNLGSPGHVTKWLQPLREFVIDTPCENAQKMYVGNAMSGNYAAVFAQLIINGRAQGLHCFIVPVRDENGSLYLGVTAIDMMLKEVSPQVTPLLLHSVDNGILIFDKVQIPRETLLDKFGSVAPDGQCLSPIKKSMRLTMMAALIPSRAVTFQTIGAMKLGLTVAIRYSHR
ncbi:LOW QUALITY PROTEIN: acyl-coenzyme A oxidase-like protein [Erethizon dorsatum]